MLLRSRLSPARAFTLVAAAFVLGAVAGAVLTTAIPGRPGSVAPPEPASLAALRLAPGSHSVDVLRVNDGDTFEARVHVWPGIQITTKVRLRGIDAAELNARCPEELRQAEAARDALRELLGKAASASGKLRSTNMAGALSPMP